MTNIEGSNEAKMLYKQHFVSQVTETFYFAGEKRLSGGKKRQTYNEITVTTEELCKGRDSEEYFRLSTEGDCRDVVR